MLQRAVDRVRTVTVVCPSCHGTLDPTSHELACRDCGDRYSIDGRGRLDLRLQRAKVATIATVIGPQRKLKSYPTSLFEPKVPGNVRAIEALDNPRWTSGSRLTPEVMSHFPDPPNDDAVALDVGCGDGAFEPLLERLGYAYTGVDFADPAAPMFADSRALPFPDESFDLVLAIGVLEHVEQPDLATMEAFRVLRPGGYIVGEVAFNEPFHDNSFFHHSVLGIASMLERHGFTLEALSPNRTWTVLKAHTLMCLLHGMPWGIARILMAPLQIAHRVWWKVAHLVRKDDDTSELSRIYRTTGGTTFVARKSVDASPSRIPSPSV